MPVYPPGRLLTIRQFSLINFIVAQCIIAVLDLLFGPHQYCSHISQYYVRLWDADLYEVLAYYLTPLRFKIIVVVDFLNYDRSFLI
jgi:hypothetical protein